MSDTETSARRVAPPAWADAIRAAPCDADRSQSLRLVVGLSSGHAVKHFYQQGLILLLPHIRDALGLSNVAVGGIVAARAIAMGVMNVPAGVLTDMFRHRVALMLTASMGCLTVGYLLVGVAHHYWLILLAVTVAGAGTSLWHAPAFSTLAERYPDRKAFTFALHRSGGSIGDTAAPVVVGVLLGGLSFWGLNWGGFGWRTVALLHVVPSALTAVAIIATFGSSSRGPKTKVSLAQYFRSVLPMTRNATVISMVLLSALRGMAHTSLQVFLVIYMKDSVSKGGLGYTDFTVGYHIALLTLLGIVAAPILGVTSDRIGRRPVIVISMTAMAATIFGFSWANSGVPLTITLALLGVFIFAINPIMTATAMDVIERGTEGSAVAMLFTGGAIIGAIAPIYAGMIFSNWHFQGVVLYAGSIATAGAVLALVLPMGVRSARKGGTA